MWRKVSVAGVTSLSYVNNGSEIGDIAWVGHGVSENGVVEGIRKMKSRWSNEVK